MKDMFSRRDVLEGISGLPFTLATGAALGQTEDFGSARARNPGLIGFAPSRGEQLTASMTTQSGRLPPDLTGTFLNR